VENRSQLYVVCMRLQGKETMLYMREHTLQMLGIGLRVVLRDRLGQCLVGLKREQHINSLRDLGLVCLTGGLVRRTRHRWSRRRGSCR
jgi:hypothetical protein